MKQKGGLLRKIGIGFLAMSAIGLVMGFLAGGTGSDKAATPQGPKKPTMNSIAAGCQVAWEMALKSKMRDPSSLDWDVRSSELGMYKNKPVIAVPYRARNGFNGITLEQAICHIDPETGDTKAVLK